VVSVDSVSMSFSRTIEARKCLFFAVLDIIIVQKPEKTAKRTKLATLSGFVTANSTPPVSLIFETPFSKIRILCTKFWMFCGKSQLKRSQNIFPKILGTFKIKNLAASNCIKDWDKVVPGRASVL